MRTDLDEDPVVVALAAQQNVTVYNVIGALWLLWRIGNTHSTDGALPGYSPAIFDAKVQLPGFCAALAALGWLVVTPKQLLIPRFERWNGRGTKRRLKARDAMRAKRGGDHSVAAERNETRTREEKSREEKNKDSLSPTPLPQPKPERCLPSDRPDLAPAARKVLEHYEQAVTAHHARGRGTQEIIGLLALGQTAEALALAADRYAAHCQANNVDKRYRVSPANFYAEGGDWERFLFAPQAKRPEEMTPAERDEYTRKRWGGKRE
jgi:hypothetical protein